MYRLVHPDYPPIFHPDPFRSRENKGDDYLNRLHVWQPSKHEPLLASIAQFPQEIVGIIGSFFPGQSLNSALTSVLLFGLQSSSHSESFFCTAAFQGKHVETIEFASDQKEAGNVTYLQSGEILFSSKTKLHYCPADSFQATREVDFQKYAHDICKIEQIAATDDVCAVSALTSGLHSYRYVFFVAICSQTLEILGKLHHFGDASGFSHRARMLFLKDGRLLHGAEGGDVQIYSRKAGEPWLGPRMEHKSFFTGLACACHMCELGEGIVVTATCGGLAEFVQWSTKSLQTLRRFCPGVRYLDYSTGLLPINQNRLVIGGRGEMIIWSLPDGTIVETLQ